MSDNPSGEANQQSDGGVKRSAPETTENAPSAGKRARTENEPTKVVHVRNLPQEAQESDLMTLGSMFGQPVKVLVLKGKGQGFVQLADVGQAKNMVEYSQKSGNLTCRGRVVYVQYSGREEITVNSSANSQQSPTKVLHVSIFNVLYPITVDVINQVFQSYGQILKVVIYEKNGLQALVEYAELTSANQAKTALNGQNIYASCCTLHITYSGLKEVSVKYNNERSRDFTNPTLPPGPENGQSIFPVQTGGMHDASALLGMPMGHQAPFVAAGLMGAQGVMPGSTNSMVMGQHMTVGAGAGMRPGMPVAQGMTPYSGNAAPQTVSTVLIVNGLPEDKFTVDTLFVLFGVYGDVLRVKILFNKRSTALIQFTNRLHAESALHHLHNLEISPGHKITVNFSKYMTVELPKKEVEDTSGLKFTKDFTGSPIHRFKQPGSKNYNNIALTLHLSNIAGSASEDSIKAMFDPYGKVENFRYFNENKKMALLKMSTLEEAIMALANLHNTLVDGSYLRLTFSKSSL